MRLTACFGVPLEIVGPTVFALDDRSLKRAALDYGPLGDMTVHESWPTFASAPGRGEGRLVLLTTRGAVRLDAFRFAPGDTLLLGRESAGVPDFVHAAAAARVVVPLRAAARSLNLAVTAGIALWEALRQTERLPV